MFLGPGQKGSLGAEGRKLKISWDISCLHGELKMEAIGSTRRLPGGYTGLCIGKPGSPGL